MSAGSRRTIVVGLDNTPGSHAALRWAVNRASATGAVVRAIHAIRLPGSAESLEKDISGTRAAVQSHAYAWAADATAGLQHHVLVSIEVKDGDASTVLSQAARDAEALVLGKNADGVDSPLAGCVVPTTCDLVTVDETNRAHYLRRAARATHDQGLDIRRVPPWSAEEEESCVEHSVHQSSSESTTHPKARSRCIGPS